MCVDEWKMLTRLGWTVVIAPYMRDTGCLVETQRIALIDGRLSPDERLEAARGLLTLALDYELGTYRVSETRLE